MTPPSILIAGDDDDLLQSIKTAMLLRGAKILEASDRAGILTLGRQRSPDLVILGSSLGKWDGLEVAREIRRDKVDLPIILIPARSTEELVIAALRAGVTDYFRRPVPSDEVILSVTRCLAKSRARSARWGEQSRPPVPLEGPLMIGDGPSVRAIMAYIAKVAPTDSNVLITGETGTGKELTAELIHQNSPRRQGPLVCVNCAAIPDSLVESELFGYERGAFTGAATPHAGTLELADGGTAFFDEIGDMSPYAQAKILRAIETKQVCRLGGRRSVSLDVRIIAATNQDLDRLVAEGRFRKDLYYRFNVASIQLPALRDRQQDIPTLLEHYLRLGNAPCRASITGFTPDALQSLLDYEWPGNVRELKNLVEKLVLDGQVGKVSVLDLPRYMQQLPGSKGRRNQTGRTAGERDVLLSALQLADWNKSRAAENLRWSRMKLYRKLMKYHITRADHEAGPIAEAVTPGRAV